jgi:DNA-binding MarR family transcriptional regulator
MCATLRRAMRAVTRLYDEELRGSGLKSGQYGLLLALSRGGPMSQGRIGELLVLDHSTLSRTLRPMVVAGLVAVRTGDDRRERIVEATPRGLRLLEKATPDWERAQARLRKALGESQWRALAAAAHTTTNAALRG